VYSDDVTLGPLDFIYFIRRMHYLVTPLDVTYLTPLLTPSIRPFVIGHFNCVVIVTLRYSRGIHFTH